LENNYFIEGFSICQELLEGDSFGEVALRTEGYRTASAIAMSETYLLGLTANSYYNVLKRYNVS
jgi:CRP-like cAMP-binding protein